MSTTPPIAVNFREGDEVILVQGTYPGTPGRFLAYRDDRNWADIRERNGRVRSHPVEWLAHNPSAGRALPIPASPGQPAR